ncbi:hypothetical protein F53441_6135 [Fusarium austroafricanum]|uniref:2EXR domain-containing protein n=1 Tax=Fusarium austroafricanum TaxID=2364996 RepID=A0A8H4KJC3_9HYPO|nr:hypothetical protein F53441_6135 [Fusarium austroafricanum]
MASFERFLDLPRELRDEIWNLTIREDRPGVQIFGRYNENKKSMAEGRSLITCYDEFGRLLSAPSWYRYFDSLDECSSDKNISTYTIDGGLWTACKESRRAMEKHFQQSKWPDKWNAEDDSQFKKSYTSKEVFKMPSTGYFADDVNHLEKGPHHYLTVFPHRDLFIWQPDTMNADDWHRLPYDWSFGSVRAGFQGIHHVAIEYNPKWWDAIREGWSHDKWDEIWEFIHIVTDEWGHNWKFWFVDPTLKRKKDAHAFKEKGNKHSTINAFYATDRKFLEINYNSKSDAREAWEYIKPAGDKSDLEFSTSPDFLRRLDEETWDSIKWDETEHENIECDFGLLGWDDL